MHLLTAPINPHFPSLSEKHIRQRGSHRLHCLTQHFNVFITITLSHKMLFHWRFTGSGSAWSCFIPPNSIQVRLFDNFKSASAYRLPELNCFCSEPFFYLTNTLLPLGNYWWSRFTLDFFCRLEFDGTKFASNRLGLRHENKLTSSIVFLLGTDLIWCPSVYSFIEFSLFVPLLFNAGLPIPSVLMSSSLATILLHPWLHPRLPGW